jgi:hypothetical protein
VDSLVCQGAWFLLCLAGVLGITVLNDGHFSYILDDAYIHLAVAEEIARGNYGVNTGEFSAPSSSVLWPFLFAPFALFSWGHFAPLILGVLSISLTIEIVLRRLRVLLPDSTGDKGRPVIARIALTAATLIFSNALWMVFIGLEHGLQILVTITTVDVILASLAGERARPWHFAAICLAPLVRYENLSFTGATAFFFLLQRRWSLAAVTLGIPVLLLAAFSAFLVANGCWAVPNSVIVKSGGAGSLAYLVGRVEGSLAESRGYLVVLLTFPLFGIAWLRRPWDKIGMAAVSLGLAGVLHFLVRTTDFQLRYDPYMLAGLFFGAVGMGLGLYPRPGLSAIPRLAALLGAFAFFSNFGSLRITQNIPVAGNNIHEQQYQMHRFATEFWKRPVAVNDLGWVSYRNDNYVLDLWGLASKEALVARKTRDNSQWMADLATGKGVGLAMIYPAWFGGIPPSWENVATMKLSRVPVTTALGSVSFYATGPGFAPELRDLLRQFRTTLPPDVILEIHEKNP